MTAHILYITADGDPHRVLAPGACGARVPMAWWHASTGEPYSRSEWCAGEPPYYHRRRKAPTALALAWRGAPVPEGVDRLARRLAERWSRGRVVGGALWHRERDAWGDCWRLTVPSGHGESGIRPSATSPADLGDLLDLWALAVTCAERLGGRAEVVRG